MFRNNTQQDDDTPSSSLRHNINNETRWQSFRALNRNRPLKQVRTIATVLICIMVYSYSLLSCSIPNYNHAHVLELNALQKKIVTKQREQDRIEAAKRRSKRQESLRASREAREQRLAQLRNETLMKQQQALQQMMVKPQNTNSTTSTENNLTRQQGDALYRFLNFFSSMVAFFTTICLVRIVLRMCLYSRGVITTTTTTRAPTAAAQRRNARQSRFREWVRNLNRQRRQQGERPLSMASLRLVLRERELTDGNDYDGLLNFSDESGPAMQALFTSMGATVEEINRCPQRTLHRGDDLLKPSSNGVMPSCSVCLELYEEGSVVRTIPCFHTFHTQCIDPWLSQKAQCPVCKHPAVA